MTEQAGPLVYPFMTAQSSCHRCRHPHLKAGNIGLALKHLLKPAINGGRQLAVVAQLLAVQLLEAADEGQIRLGCDMRLAAVLLKVLLQQQGGRQAGALVTIGDFALMP